ncbi:carbohydrate ABC transporter permease [Microbacterium invictum]|uniref:Multiple sugar transport system permease protein n=1 Tax=Microbacterium invictum TaxID=515415 RepID=A0AA40SRI6_9MICO|nr:MULTISPECIES: carbohydrate ABC transporter permease [Microbacterium]MBB4141080.1 multiple sugar transport system permease protein [Microbacterium invictum]
MTLLSTRGDAATRRRPEAKRGIRPLVAGVLAALFAFPVVWTVIGSFKPFAEANASPPVWWPSELSFDSYEKLGGSSGSLWLYVTNSLMVTLMTVAITTVVATLGGYAFARFRFPGKGALFGLTVGMLLVPYPALLVSLFTVMIWFGLTNSLFGLALIYSTFQMPFAIYMMKNSFESIPGEIIEASEIDGCTPISALYRLLLPLVAPGMVTVALFAFLAGWNEFIAALVLLNDNAMFTLPIALVNAQSGPLNTIDWGALQAGITVTMMPCIVLFIALQKYYVSGLIAGAGK